MDKVREGSTVSERVTVALREPDAKTYYYWEMDWISVTTVKRQHHNHQFSPPTPTPEFGKTIYLIRLMDKCV